jgi:hypothetical protein
MSSSPKQPVVGPSTPAPSPDRSPEQGRRFAKSVHVRIVKDQLKVAHAPSDVPEKAPFEFYCDEPPPLGGEDRFPQPLHYIAAGVGF